jgi:hypothetical protein
VLTDPKLLKIDAEIARLRQEIDASRESIAKVYQKIEGLVSDRYNRLDELAKKSTSSSK